MRVPTSRLLASILLATSTASHAYTLEHTLRLPPELLYDPRTVLTHPCQIAPADDDHDNDEWIDDTQALLAQTSCRAALWLDSLFGNDIHDDAAQQTSGRLEVAGLQSQIDGFKPRVRFRVNMELPNLKKRASAFLGRDNEEEFIKGRSEAFGLRSQFPRMDQSDQWLAGLGYALPGSEHFSANIKVGATHPFSPRFFLRGRLYYSLYADALNVIYANATPFWQTHDGVGITVGVNYSRILSPRLLLRFSEVGTVSQSTIGMDWLTAVILYQNLHHQRALAYQLFVRGDTGAPVDVFEYGGRVLYRHPLIAQKLFLQPTIGYSWPRFEFDAARQGSYEIGIGIEIPFGKDER